RGAPAARRPEGGAEGLVRLHPMQLAREHGDRGTAKRFGANRDNLRIGNELCDERGIAALTPRRPGSGGDQERHSLQPSRQAEEPPQGGGIRPVSPDRRSADTQRCGGDPALQFAATRSSTRSARPDKAVSMAFCGSETPISASTVKL